MLRSKNIFISSLILLALILSACSVSQGTQTAATENAATVVQQESTVPDQVLEYTQGEDALVNIYKNVNPGVATILVYTSDGGVGQGSGFVYDLEGHIITNYHVIENATKIEITFPEGTRTLGEVIGTDMDSDLAVIKVDVATDVLHPLTLGNSSELAVGQFVIAIGNPYGFNGTMTTGIISALGRVLDSIRSSQTGSAFAAGDTIQTDAAINPGNSGGPLLNLNGEVIGINRAIYDETSSAFESASYNGIGFAIPIDIVKRVVPYLISVGSYDYPYLGISSLDGLTMDEVEAMGFDTSTQGIFVLDVTTGGPAAKAGIRAGTRTTKYNGLYAGGDLITAVDGTALKNYNQLLTYMFMNKAPGDTITVTVLRNGTERNIEVTLGSRSDQ
ncbi:MAG: S1C family serine protease [Anaerolineaceae bacterium]